MSNESTKEDGSLLEKKENLSERLARQAKERQERHQRILENLRRERTVKEHGSYYASSRNQSEQKISAKIEDTEEKRTKELENDAREQDIELKKTTLNRLFYFLSGETIVIFILTILQGFKWWHFYLEEWSFRLLVAATISQITIMLQFAVKHLFPNKR